MSSTDYRAPVDADFVAILKGKSSITSSLRSALILFGILAIVVYAVFDSYVAAVAVGGGLFMASLWSNVRFFNTVNARRRLVQDDRAVEVIAVKATTIVDIEAPGSTGPAFVFFDDSTEALLVVGQWTLEFAPFPVADFKIHRWADTKEPIRIESSGTSVLPHTSSAVIHSNHRIGKVESFTASADSLQMDLDAAFGVKQQ